MRIDVHAHITDNKLIADYDRIVSNMEKDGLLNIIDTGSSRESSEIAYEHAQKYNHIYCAVGIHPECALEATSLDYARFKEMYKNEKVVAIGEIGLDYYYKTNPPKEEQIRVFNEQIELAYELNAPIVVHVRDAYGDALKILNENKSKLNGVLLHCYSGSKELVREFGRLDTYFSLGGVVTFKNAKEKPEVIKAIPIERLLLETDSPYMAPEPFRGTINEPKNTFYVAKKIAEVLNKEQQAIEEITTQNARRLFKKLI